MGNDQSFDEYVAASFLRLSRSATLLLGEFGADAEDVVQETLVAVYLRWQSIRNPDARDSYTSRALVRACRRYRRKAAFRRERVARLPSAESGPEQVLSEYDATIHHALSQLPQRQREVLVLRFFRDLSVEQTARAMHCSEGTVKSQTSKGLSRLRRTLDGREDDAVIIEEAE